MTMHPSGHIDGFARAQLPPEKEWPILNLTGVYAAPPRQNAAVELLDRIVAAGQGHRVALVTPDGDGGWLETTYAELAAQVDALAHVLVTEMGLVSGNRVLLRGYNGRWLAAAWLATLKAGMVAVTTMPMLRSTELRVIIDKAACNGALCDARLHDELWAAGHGKPMIDATRLWGGDSGDLEHAITRHSSPFRACDTASDDVALIAFTSGTTGVPKGCMHFHRDVMAMCTGFAQQVLRIAPDDICIGTPPLAFTFGLGGLLCFPLSVGASAALVEKATPESLLDAIAATRATITCTAPTFYRQMALLIQQRPGRFDTRSLRTCVSAGEALPDATRTLWRDATGIEMLDGIGATELIHIFIAAAGRDVRPGAIGRAVPGYDVAVLDDELRPVPNGDVGRLAVRGPTGCRYLADDRQRAYVQGGWNLTGDAATMDDDGYVFFKARTDDLIISAGYNIGAPEVEAAVLQHEAVLECAVVGIPDVDRGQAVKAFVVLKPGRDGDATLARAIQDHVKATIAPYKYPRHVEFVAALPKTDTGKLQRFRLKQAPEGDIVNHRILQPAGWPRPRGYANGVSARGRQIFVAGQIGWNPRGELAGSDLTTQARQALENIVAILATDGARPGHLVRLTWYVTNRQAYLDAAKPLGEAYREVIGAHFPAMTAVEVSALMEPGAVVEIEATAVVPESGEEV